MAKSTDNTTSHCPEDVEEISLLQWHCQRPVNASVPNWRLLDAHPVLAHVEIMQRSDESGDQPLPALCDLDQEEAHLAIPIAKPIHRLTMRCTQRWPEASVTTELTKQRQKKRAPRSFTALGM